MVFNRCITAGENKTDVHIWDVPNGPYAWKRLKEPRHGPLFRYASAHDFQSIPERLRSTCAVELLPLLPVVVRNPLFLLKITEFQTKHKNATAKISRFSRAVPVPSLYASDWTLFFLIQNGSIKKLFSPILFLSHDFVHARTLTLSHRA